MRRKEREKERKERERKKGGRRRKRRGERKRKKKKREKEKIERKNYPSSLQLLLVCSSINKVRGSEVKLLYINLDKLMGFILIFYLF